MAAAAPAAAPAAPPAAPAYASIDALLAAVSQEAGLEARLRAALSAQPKEFLVEQLLRVHASRQQLLLPPLPRAPPPAVVESDAALAARAQRITAWRLDTQALQERWRRLRDFTRKSLEAGGYLAPGAPRQGGQVVPPSHRTPAGQALLEEAQDALVACLYGDGDLGVDLPRVRREMLTFFLPKAKAHRVSYLLRADTEVEVEGNWRDPCVGGQPPLVSRPLAHARARAHALVTHTQTSPAGPRSVENAHDEHAINIMVEVEFGEISEGLVGHFARAALTLINLLDVNEQLLYARINKVDESTLVEF